MLIVPYYSVIGGWVIKYLFEYLRGNAQGLAEDGYFSAFIADGASAEVCFLLFAFFTLGIIFAGVRNGVERVSRLMMPVRSCCRSLLRSTRSRGPAHWRVLPISWCPTRPTSRG